MLATDSWLSQNAYDLPVCARTLAQMCGVELAHQSTHEEIQSQLWPIWGSKPAFETAIPSVAEALKLDGTTTPNEQVLDCLTATGLLDEIMLRSVVRLFTPDRPIIFLIYGCTAAWLRRRIALFLRLQELGVPYGGLFLLANSERLCNTETEVNNPDVVKYQEEHDGAVPNEAQLAVQLANEMTGRSLKSVHIDANSQDAQTRELFTQFPVLAHGSIGVITNANATYVPLQVRRVAREIWPSFDKNYDQLVFAQDGFPLARTPEQAQDRARFQHPLTVFPGLVRFINEIHLLQARAA